jgi:hypothetical protein
MLVARREPPFHADPHDPEPINSGVYGATKASRFTRFVTALQLTGSLLAVPVGIASAYSFYRANFSPETTCQNLRSGIVAMLDKSVDAATRRILVRRDVEAFEKTCGTVDPDATAAFKTLLEVEKTAPPPKAATAAAPSAPKGQHVETLPKEPVRKIEPRPQPVAKQPAASVANAEAEPARREPAVSDTQWLDAVRQALVTHKREIRAAEPVKVPVAIEPSTKAMPHEAALPAPAAAAPSVPAATPPAPVAAPPAAIVPTAPTAVVPAAPALPAPISIAPPPPAQQADTDHPVPPGAIPESAPPVEKADTAKPEEHGKSRVRKWISEIPLLGSVVENGRQ